MHPSMSTSLLVLALSCLAPMVLQAQSLSVESRTPAGAYGNDINDGPRVTPDGRWVVFRSYANNLVPGDTNNAPDTFVRDRQSGVITRVSVSSAGVQGNDFSYAGFPTADGRYIGFGSEARNFAAGDTNGFIDAFLHDRQTGQTVCISTSPAGTPGDRASAFLGWAGDRFGLILSTSTNLVSGDTNNVQDGFAYDRQSATLTRVTLGPGGVQANHDTTSLALSDDGRWVAFTSLASNLAPGDTNNRFDVFLHDRQSTDTLMLSRSASGAIGDANSGAVAISADGRYVAFSSSASNLVPGDSNGVNDIFLYDRLSGSLQRISELPGVQANGFSSAAHFTPDGGAVAFITAATNLFPNDNNQRWDIVLRETSSGQIRLLSRGAGGVQGDADHGTGNFCAQRACYVFSTSASNYAAGTPAGISQVYYLSEDGLFASGFE